MRIGIGIVALSTLAAVPAAAQSINEDLKLTASDANNADRFGWTVGISDGIAITGAWGNDDSGSASGSAYLFDASTGQQLFKLTANDADFDDSFGAAVGISGNSAIVGAWRNDDGGSESGSAYLFDTTTGEQLFKLTASDAASGDLFGYSVAISGTTVIVGAIGETFLTGAAYIYDTTTGQQLYKLTAEDADGFDEFGTSVAISGNIAIIGAPSNNDAGSSSGSAYLFDITTGQQLFKLTASDAESFDKFGASVDISGNIAIVGADDDDDAGSNSGSAYLFDTTTGQQVFKLTAADGAAFDSFGAAVAISGTTAIVTAPNDDDAGSNSGSAYLFDTTTGQQISKIISSDATTSDSFGRSAAISSAAAIVGTPQDDDAGASSGSAYLFNLNPTNTCPADVTGDSTVDLADLNLILANFGSTTDAGDANGDGVVDLADLNAVLAAFGQACP